MYHNLIRPSRSLCTWLLGNSTGIPRGIVPVTLTHPMESPYLSGHGFTHQNKPKNIQNGPEMKEIYIPNFDEFCEIGCISLNFGPKNMFLDSFKSSREGYHNLYPSLLYLYPWPAQDTLTCAVPYWLFEFKFIENLNKMWMWKYTTKRSNVLFLQCHLQFKQ